MIDTAEGGEPVTITRHGTPVAMIVPFSKGEEVYRTRTRSIADVLLEYPGGLDLERDHTPPREIDL